MKEDGMKVDATFLFAVFSKIIPLSQDLRDRISSTLKEEFYPKRFILLREGQVNRKIYFIKEGFARAFYYNQGKEYTSWFMGTGDVMISVYSFFTRQQARESIEIVEDSTLLSMTWEQLQEIYREFPEFNIVGRILTEQYYIKSEERTIELRTLTAKERYHQLVNKYQQILQKVSLTHIATYLGINRETLSRIRGQLIRRERMG